jgi:hypothetical protein
MSGHEMHLIWQGMESQVPDEAIFHVQQTLPVEMMAMSMGW